MIFDFPAGHFFIRNVATGLVLDVEGNATAPGSRVIVWGRKSSGYNNQLWRYDNGFLINRLSGLVLEVPNREGGGFIAPGTGLVVTARREIPDNLHQLWANIRQMLVPYDPRVAITARDASGSPAVVDSIQINNPSFEWEFVVE